MAMYHTLPEDAVMLLSFVNTQLRDHYTSFDAFVKDYQANADKITDKLRAIEYEYDASVNQFI